MTGQLVVVAAQADFEKWISENFVFQYQGKTKQITPKYANSTISRNLRSAKGNRLIEVILKDGEFQIVPLALKNREQD